MKIVFQISQNCMKAEVRAEDQEGHDVLDNLASKLRANQQVLDMLDKVASGESDFVNVTVSVQ